MDIVTPTNIAIGAMTCAYAVTVYGLTKSLVERKDEVPPVPQAPIKLSSAGSGSSRIPLDGKESLRSEERKADIRNRVVQVDSFLKDTDSKEIPNPMVVAGNQQALPGRFLTLKSCIPTGAFTIGDRQYKSQEELLAATRYKRAGPKAHLYYDPDKVKAAIVTCGGICPGENVVIRELVLMLWYSYGVHEIFGVKYGFDGFWKTTPQGDCFVKLMPELPPNLKEIPKSICAIKDIHTRGGTLLGSARGGFDTEKIIESLQTHGINQVYAIGGDGTHKGLLALSKALKKQQIEVTLIGIPKTIDNDMPLLDKTFGLLVKVMGRYAGHIAMHASLANRDVNICLIPEVPFDVYGSKGLFEYIMRRLKERGHCVIVVAEGAGVALRDVTLEQTAATDPWGNIIPPVSQLGLLER